MTRLALGLVAAPLLLASSPAMATSPCVDACHFTASPSQCALVVTGGCSAQCTPISVQAQCDGTCTASASATCTESCQTSCESQCNVDPGSFQCEGSCNAECKASCQTTCDGANGDCETDCEADCGNRCDLSCNVNPPSVNDCMAQCQASCNGSCEVQANVDCQGTCTASATGGCTAECSEPQGAIFCNGQYVSFSEAADCVTCLETNGFTLNASVSCTGSNCLASAGVCSASPAVGSSEERWGVFGITGLMVGLGLIASRRRSRQ